MEMEMEFLRKLPTPQELKEQFPVSAQIVATKAKDIQPQIKPDMQPSGKRTDWE